MRARRLGRGQSRDCHRRFRRGLPSSLSLVTGMAATASRHLLKLDDGEHVRFLNIHSAFLDENGQIPPSPIPDQLHFSPAGYEAWARAIQPRLAEMRK